MTKTLRLWALALAASSLAVAAICAQGPPMGSVRNLDDMEFAAIPATPGCSSSALQSGDPATGPSIAVARLATGCTVPWHWHTPNERLMMVSGVARVEMQYGGQPLTLRAGGFAEMPSRHVHRFTCTSACVLYVASDAPFDIHYVDQQGEEITPEKALGTDAKTASSDAG